jgi:hypothetical protein
VGELASRRLLFARAGLAGLCFVAIHYDRLDLERRVSPRAEALAGTLLRHRPAAISSSFTQFMDGRPSFAPAGAMAFKRFWLSRRSS